MNFYLRAGEATNYCHWIDCECGEKRLSFDSVNVAQVDVSNISDKERVNLSGLYQEFLRYTLSFLMFSKALMYT